MCEDIVTVLLWVSGLEAIYSSVRFDADVPVVRWLSLGGADELDRCQPGYLLECR